MPFFSGIRFLSQYGNNASRCKATQCYDWSWQEKGTFYLNTFLNAVCAHSRFSCCKSCQRNYCTLVVYQVDNNHDWHFENLNFSYGLLTGGWLSFIIKIKNIMSVLHQDILKDQNSWLTIRYSQKVFMLHFTSNNLKLSDSNFQEYDYSLDMWSFGCMLASMVGLLLLISVLFLWNY
jgi:hypothetical protein